MKVAQLMAGAPGGGAELFFERLTIALARAGETVLPVIRRDGDRAARLTQAGLPPAQLRFGGALDLLTPLRLRRLLARFAPRVAIAWMGRAAAHAPVGDWVLVGRLGGFYDLSRFRRCDHLVANTRAIAAWIRAQGWPDGRVHHLPNFVADLGVARPAARADLGVPMGATLVVALGRLHPNKAFDVLIRALPHLPGTHAVIAGEGPERAALTRLAQAERVADRVHLPGWLADTGALLATADLLVSPSRHEPLGNVIIEAWSANRPVVACAHAGAAELLTHGTDGLIVPPEDSAALAAAIGAVLDDPGFAARLAAAGRARFARDHAEAPVLDAWRRFLATVEKP
jgi:glycosyltransferase involved in cell wall biosynthesis